MSFRVVVLLTLQLMVPTFKIGVGAVALYLARTMSVRGESSNSGSWWVTGAAMAYLGINNILQSAAAIWAYIAGPDSSFFAGYTRMMPAANQSRTFVVIGMGLLLTAIAVRRERVLPHLRIAALAVMGLATCWGAAVGWLEGSITPAHFMDKALFDAFELFSLLLALGLSLRKDSMDRLLWSCLATYAFYSALNVLWYSSLSFMGVKGAWAPDPLYTQVYATVIHAVMLGIAWQRVRRLAAHSPVQSMMESLGPAPHLSAHH